MSEINCSLTLNQAELIEVADKNHFMQHQAVIDKVYSELAQRIEPVIYYYLAGKVTAIVSLGMEVDELQEEYRRKEEYLYSYAVDCLSMPLLEKAYDVLSDHLWKNGHGAIWSYEFFGDRLSMDAITEIFDRLKPKNISYNQAFMFTPKKTTVFMAALSQEKKHACGLCSRCANKTCLHRSNKKSIMEYSYGYQRIFKK